ncbi:MAG TPA: MFS transporter [Planctomycetes bacterium]|nr:MFS transporter [Planctomycetota bacterium]
MVEQHLCDSGGNPDDARAAADAASLVPPDRLRSALVLSTLGTMLGAFYFPLAGGNTFNRFLELIDLNNRIGLFMGLPGLAAMTALLGSWLIQRTGYRRAFFFLLAGPPRLLWFAMITVPLWGPESRDGRTAILCLLGLAYWIANSVSSSAWFSWMRDIVPEHYRGRLFSYRNTLVTLVSAIWGLAAGYILEKLGLDLFAFRTVYAIGVAFGIMDIIVYLFVYHPPMRMKDETERGFVSMVKAAVHKDFLKFTGVQALWLFSCSMVALSMWHVQRGIGMEIYSIQVAGFFGTCVWLAFSLLWGRFIDHYGSKAAWSAALVSHAVSPVFYALAPYFGQNMVYLGICFGGIAMSGLTLANTTLLISLSSREDQAMTMAARAFVSGMVVFVSFTITESVLFPGLEKLGGRLGYCPLFKVTVVCTAAALLRAAVFAISLRLPEVEDKPPAGIIVKMFLTTNPLRALYSFGRFLAVKTSETVGNSGYSRLHPSARWQPPAISDADDTPE